MRPFILFLALALLVGGAGAESFAKLSVVAKGEQRFDIATGVTTLPEGGKVTDAERGIYLESSYIEYLEGSYVEAQGAVVEGRFGRFSAERLRLDLKSGELRASGELRFDGNGLTVRADELLLNLDADVLRLSGNVSSSAPSFETQALVLELDDNRALLVAPYRYQEGALTLSQGQAGSLLQLTQETLADGSQRYSPSTDVQAEVLQALTPYLPY